MRCLRAGIGFFFHFHRGAVNIILHLTGFVLCIYSLWLLNWQLFAISIVMIESGHVYNHIRKIEPYDFRPHVCFWRIFFFILFVLLVYLLAHHLR